MSGVFAVHHNSRLVSKGWESQDATKGVRNPPRILIFVNRVKTVRFLHSTISSAGFKVAMLHGERTQAEREVC